MSTIAAKATEIFDAMEHDERWLGFGYIGGRRNARDSSDPESPAIDEARVRFIDRLVVEYAAFRGWTADQLFDWANSRDGRYFADATLEPGTDPQSSFDRAVDRWNLLRVQS